MSDSQKQSILKIIKNNNIFGDITDGIFYCICYILIPVIVAFCSLSNVTENLLDQANNYAMILINAFGCLYDNISRFRKATVVARRKLLIIHMSSTVIISIYCLAIVLCILITKACVTFDFIFILYIVPVFLAVFCVASSISRAIYVVKE